MTSTDSQLEYKICALCGLPSDFERELKQRSLRSMSEWINQRYSILKGELDKAIQNGMTHKIWKTVAGNGARKSHYLARNQKVLIDDYFVVGGHRLFLPCDPNVPFILSANCRCMVEFRKEDLGQQPTKAELLAEVKKLSAKYNVPERALVALFGAESDFRQYGPQGLPLISPSPISSAGGIGQVTRTTAQDYYEDYERLLVEWRYNADVAVKVYSKGYHHAWNRNVADLRIRAARAYGMYHDGFEPQQDRDMYRRKPRGLTGEKWEQRYLTYY